jgi:hypothetical protein
MTSEQTEHDLRKEEFDRKLRQIIREEIAEAFQVLSRAADHLDEPYETTELDSRALQNVVRAAQKAADRVACEHGTYRDWYAGERRCAECGEPEKMPANPFEEEVR